MGVGLSFLAKIQPFHVLAFAAFFLPLKPAPVNVFLLVAVVWLLASREGRARVRECIKHPITITLLLLLAWLLVTLGFETSNVDQARDYLSKYLRLLLIPVLAACFVQPRSVPVVAWAFCLGVLVSVLGSFLVYFGVFAWPSGSESPLLFKLHITHNFFIALAVGYAGHWFYNHESRTTPAVKVAVLLLSLLCLYNFFFMVEGRSGWVALATLPLTVAFMKYRWVGMLVAGALVVVLSLLLYSSVDLVSTRVDALWLEVQQWLQGESIAKDTSNGRRLSFWLHSIQAFLAAPWVGYGMGGFENAVQPYVSQAGFFLFNNPHNQYLLFAVQGGVVALLLYALFIAALLRYAPRPQGLLIGVVLAYTLLNVLNSFHYDFAEGIFFIVAVAALAYPKQNQLSAGATP